MAILINHDDPGSFKSDHDHSLNRSTNDDHDLSIDGSIVIDQ